MNNIHNFDISLPVENRNFKVLKYYLDLDNSVYVLCKVDKPKEDKVKGQSDYYYTVMVVSPITGQLTEYRLGLDGKEITSVRLIFNSKKEGIIAAGFYGDINENKRGSTGINGFFSLTMNPTNMDIIREDYTPLDVKFIEQLLGMKDSSMPFKDSFVRRGVDKEFYISQIIEKRDGGTVIIGQFEVYYVDSKTAGNVTLTDTRNTFVIQLDAEAKITALTDIPKFQLLYGDRGMFNSFCSYQLGERLFIFFNDHKNNMKKDVRSYLDAKILKKAINSVLVAVEVMPDGTYTKQQIWNNKKSHFIASPKRAVLTSNNELLMPAASKDGNNIKVLKITELAK